MRRRLRGMAVPAAWTVTSSGRRTVAGAWSARWCRRVRSNASNSLFGSVGVEWRFMWSRSRDGSAKVGEAAMDEGAYGGWPAADDVGDLRVGEVA